MLSLLIAACEAPDTVPPTDDELAATTVETGATEEQIAFFNNLQAFCGQTFRGESTYMRDPEAASDLQRGPLFLTFESCTDTEIRLPLVAAGDSSRTWVLTLEDEGLLFKHMHLYPDGSPHDVHNYGGYASPEGSETEQFFPADEFTRELLPEAATNVWSMTIDRANDEFIYYLERHDQPRFRAVFDISEPVEDPADA